MKLVEYFCPAVVVSGPSRQIINKDRVCIVVK